MEEEFLKGDKSDLKGDLVVHLVITTRVTFCDGFPKTASSHLTFVTSGSCYLQLCHFPLKYYFLHF